MDLSSLVDEALKVQCGSFVETIDKATALLQKASGQFGNLTIDHHLVILEPIGEALVIGDLHGDLGSLVVILQSSRFLEKMERKTDTVLIFLGDYGDRGEKSVELYSLILKLKLAFPEQVVLLRGNHEAPRDLLGYPHDLPFLFQSRFGYDWRRVYQKTKTLWNYLYNAVYVENRYLMVHGGVSLGIRNLRDIAQAQENHNVDLLEDLLWSDPDEDIQGVSYSPRGAGKLFGKNVTEEVLRCVNAQVLIRAHESSDFGFRINHGGKVLTLFSRKGSPYFNKYGAYLLLPFFKKIENAEQLVPWVHKF